MEQLRNDRAAFAGGFADGGGVVEAARFLEDLGFFEVGVGGVVVGHAGAVVVFEFEFVECSLDFFHDAVDGEAFFLLVAHGEWILRF